MTFNEGVFLEAITWEGFDVLKKPDLMTMYLNLGVRHAMRKQDIKNMLINRLVDDDFLGEFYLDNMVDIGEASDSAVKLKQLEIQKEMEMLKLQLQQERLEIEEQERKP